MTKLNFFNAKPQMSIYKYVSLENDWRLEGEGAHKAR